ncbi:MAG: glycosyltransferase family 4 protein [Promethearchaeota archaeon]
MKEKNKKIIYLTMDFIDPIFSGNGTLSRLQVLNLVKCGYKIMVLCPSKKLNSDKEVMKFIKSGKLIVERLEINSKKNLSISCDWRGFCKKGTNIIEKLRQFKPDFVIGIDWHTADLALNIKDTQNVPLIAEFFRVFSYFKEYFDNKEDFQTVRNKEISMVINADITCVLSNIDKKWALRNGAKRITVNHPPVSEKIYVYLKKYEELHEEKTQYPKNGQKFILTTISRIVREKKIHRILPIIAELKKLNFRFKYRLIGEILDPPYWEKVQDDIKRLGISENIEFIGNFLGSKIIDVLKESDCYIHTSEYEPFGISIVEVSLTGCPIFLDKNGFIGATEVIIKEKGDFHMDKLLEKQKNKKQKQSKTGKISDENIINGAFPIDFTDPKRTAEYIASILMNPILLGKTTEKANQLVEALTVENYIFKLENIILGTK